MIGPAAAVGSMQTMIFVNNALCSVCCIVTDGIIIRYSSHRCCPEYIDGLVHTC